MGLFRRAPKASAAIVATVEALAESGELKLTHPKDKRRLGLEAQGAWDPYDREERLYLIWLNTRVSVTMFRDTQMGSELFWDAMVFRETARICARMYELTYGDHIDIDRDDWGVLTEQERERAAAALPLDAPVGMRAPVE